MRQFEPIPERTEAVAHAVVEAAYRVHSALGPGLLESVYETCLCHELRKHEVPFKAQLTLPVIYDGIALDAGLRLDLLVEELVIVELKAIEKTLPVHEAQLLTYLKLSKKRLGLLINLNVPLIRDGIKRVVL
jgi:GxxExxY protein